VTFTNIVTKVVNRGRSHPERVAIHSAGDAWTYGRLAASVDTWAGRFAAGGVKAQEVVLVFLPQTAEAIAIYFGIMRCGAIPSFMPLPSGKQDPAYYWASHDRLLRLIRPSALVTESVHRSAMQGLGFEDADVRILATDDPWAESPPAPPVPDAGVDSIALLQHSSGTTSLKKGVMLSHRAISSQVAAYASALDADADDVVVSWLPMYHDMGLVACTLMPLMLGQTLVLLDPFQWSSDPGSLLTAIDRHRGTFVWLPNFAFEFLAKTVRFEFGSIDLSCVRAFVNCSEPCKPGTFDRFAARFASAGVSAAQLQVCYAMAESVFAVTQTHPGRPTRRLLVDSEALAVHGVVRAPIIASASHELVSAGSPIAGMRVRVVDADARPLADGCVGEIELEADYLFDGYFNRPELTAARLHNGRYRTNDLGFMLDDSLYVLGRSDDLIIVHGRNYFAHEVEAVANEIAGLKPGRNVAIAVFNEMLGTQEIVLIAETSVRQALTPEETAPLKRAVKHAVNQHMGLELRDVKLVGGEWLAKTTSGKISRTLNREKYLNELAMTR
jgi:fatty-acyl-CoA synthase